MKQGFYKSPIGIIKIEAEDDFIIGVDFVSDEEVEELNSVITQCKKELEQYFNGEITEFTVPIKFTGGTEFQRKVWEQLRNIPYGHKVSYKDVAERINNPKAVRAVGGANNKNKIAIIVPCHRVVGASGKMVGYAGGVDKKEFLLQLEGRYL